MTPPNTNLQPENSQSELAEKLEEKERERQRIVAINKQAAVGVIADLVEAGYPVEWVSDLFNEPMDYRSAIPILRRWLSKIDNLDVKEAIVRALSVRWAKPFVAPDLIVEFLHAPDYSTSSYKWAVGNALSVVADDSVFEDIVKIAQDRQHGRAREMVAVALGNMKNPHAVDVLIELLEDDEVSGHALLALGKLKASKAKAYIEPFLTHPKAWVRKEARRALAKIEKAK